MTTPHKHQATINAWAAGAQIQYKLDGVWRDCIGNHPEWRTDREYRIKHKWQDCIDAYERGEDVQVNSASESGKWLTLDRGGPGPGPAWLEELSYRIKPKAHKHQAVIDAYNAGQTVQCQLGDGTWFDHVPGKKGPPCFFETWEYRIKQSHQEVRDAFAAGKAVQYRSTSAGYWSNAHNPQWYSDWEYRIKPEPLKSRRYVYNRAGKQQVGICDPNTQHQVPASTFVRWIDEDWVETEV